MDPLDLLRAGVGRNLFHGDKPALIRLVGRREMPARDEAREREHQLILVRFAIHPNQPFDGYFQTGFLPDLANNGFCRQFPAFDSAAWQVPRIKVSPMAQQDTTLFIENDGKRTDCEQTGLLLEMPP